MDLQALKSALSDNEVIQAFAAALLPTLLTSIENKFAVLNGIVEKLRHDVDSVLLENDDLRTRLDTLGTENVTLRSRVEALEGDLAASTSNRLDALESYTRVDNLIIKGLPENYAEITYSTASSTDETTKTTSDDSLLANVIDMFENKLHVQVTASDISTVHRLPKGRYDRTRPVIIRFSNRRVRDKVYAARRYLKASQTETTQPSMPIYINEQLSKHNEQLFAECRRLWKNRQIGGTWTWHGTVYI